MQRYITVGSQHQEVKENHKFIAEHTRLIMLDDVTGD